MPVPLPSQLGNRRRPWLHGEKAGASPQMRPPSPSGKARRLGGISNQRTLCTTHIDLPPTKGSGPRRLLLGRVITPSASRRIASPAREIGVGRTSPTASAASTFATTLTSALCSQGLMQHSTSCPFMYWGERSCSSRPYRPTQPVFRAGVSDLTFFQLRAEVPPSVAGAAKPAPVCPCRSRTKPG